MQNIKGYFQRQRLKSDDQQRQWPLNRDNRLFCPTLLVLIAFTCLPLSADALLLNRTRPLVGCKLNPYYRPVCGSNHETYPNVDLLHCYNRNRVRGQKIRVMRHGECEDLFCPDYEQLQGRWTMENGEPVCANNGYTYGHVNQVRCLKGFIPTLDILHEGSCMIHEVRQSLGRNFRHKACHEPRLKFEQSFVCTRSNKTYDNPFKALCANPNVLEKRGGKCGCPVQRSCQKIKYLTKSLRQAPKSVRERYAVCGSDNKTYRHQHHLECARRFNSNLYKVHNGICKKNTNPCPVSLKTAFSPANPVCGSDGRSYINYQALLCAAARMHSGLKYRHSGACIQRYGSRNF